jgi:hypothetical protein
MGNSASNISSIVAPAAKANDPYVTQSYVDTNFLTNGNFTTYDNYAKSNYLNAGSLNNTLANSTLYCPPDQTYCSLSNTKAGANSIVALNGNIGIGTINPLEELHIHRTTATNTLTKYTNQNATTGLDVGVDSNGNGIIFHRDNKPISISTNNAERVIVSEGGNVGIGTTNPTHRLDIAGATRSGTHATTSRPLYITGDLSDSSNGIEIRHSNGTQGIGFGFKSIYASGSNNDQDLNIMPKGTGKVGIGTTNPSQRLDVSGNINSSGNITSSGNIGIGITSPSQRLSIGPLTSTSDVIAMSLPNNWYIKMKGATTANPAGQLCFSNGSTATTSIDYVCIDPAKTS